MSALPEFKPAYVVHTRRSNDWYSGKSMWKVLKDSTRSLSTRPKDNVNHTYLEHIIFTQNGL